MSKPEFSVLVIGGDSIGPEVCDEAVAVLEAISFFPNSRAKFNFIYWPFREQGKNADAILIGSVGGPKWDGKQHGFKGPEGATLRLQQATNVYANIQPCKHLPGGRTPLHEELAYKKSEIQQIIHIAAHLALSDAVPVKHVISYGNNSVLATSRLWRRVVTKTITNKFPEVELVHQLADSATTLMIMRPTAFNSVIMADNTFGDILSNLAGVIPGTLGVLPSACLADLPCKHWGDKPTKGFYEPVHGSAPDIAGQGIANPVGAILNAALLLRYSFVMETEARAIEEAVSQTLRSGVKTKDINGTTSTKDMGEAVRARLTAMLQTSNGV